MRSHLGIYLNVGMTASYSCIRREPLKTAIFRALADVISQHPSLSAIPIDIHGANPYFARIPQIDLERVVTFMEAKEELRDEVNPRIDEMLEDQHNRPFTLGTQPSPFWRVLVLSNATNDTRFVASFIFHHCLADGLSGVAFHRALAISLSSSSSEESKPIVGSSTIPLLPELEQLPRFGTADQRPTSEHHSLDSSPGLRESWAGNCRTQSLPVRSRFRSTRISEGATRSFMRECKANATSLTAAMQTLISESLFRILPPRITTLQSDCPVSLRNWLPEPITNESIGNFGGSFSQIHRRQTFSWDEARRCRKTISQIMDEKGHGMPFSHPEEMAADLKSWFECKIGKPRISAFELSNVGRLLATEDLRLCRLDTLLFSQSAGATSAALKISLATGPDGALTIGISWQQGIVDEDVVAHLLQDLPKRIRALGMR